MPTSDPTRCRSGESLGSNQNEGLLVTQLFYMLPSLFDTFINNFEVMGPILLFMKKALEIKDEDVLLANEVLTYYTGNRSIHSNM